MDFDSARFKDGFPRPPRKPDQSRAEASSQVPQKDASGDLKPGSKEPQNLAKSQGKPRVRITPRVIAARLSKGSSDQAINQPPTGEENLESAASTRAKSPQTQFGHIPTPSTIKRMIPRTGPVIGVSSQNQNRLVSYDETSAGGLVVAKISGTPSIAVIARRNRMGNIEWCLPKGHVELGETLQQAAVREVGEETGIHGRVITHLASIDYWFAGNNRRIHKVVHHYLMEALSGHITVENDPDHEAEDAAWIPLDQAARQLAYPNERRIVTIAQELLDLGD